MSHNLSNDLIQLQSKVSIKNLHTVRDLQVYNNQQIFIIYDSIIHIHSISKICSNLPSLLCILQLQQIVNKIQKNNYQDHLSQKITTTNRNKFGQIVFTEQLNPDKNIFASITHFRERLRFLGSEFVRVRSLQIHDLGHLLITFEDKRCILLRRLNLMNNFTNNHNLYNIQQPILINNILQSLVKECIFSSIHSINDLSLICLHLPKKYNQEIAISKVIINDINSIQIINISGKKLNIQQKGILQISYINNKNGCGWLILFYYNRVQVLQLSEINYKTKTFTILTHKQVDFKDELGDEYIVRMFRYQLPCKQQQKQIKVYLLTSSLMYQLQLSFKHQQKDINSWIYSIKKKQKNTSIKTDIYFINYKGNYLQSLLTKDNHPNLLLNLATQTDNGLMIKLQSKNNNYKQGQLFLCCQNRIYMVQKMIKSLKQRQCGQKNWINFQDLIQLQKNYLIKTQNDKYQTIKKQLLKQIQNKYKTNKNNSSIQNTILINVLVINILSIFQTKIQPVEKIINQTIKNQLNLNNHQIFNRTHCVISNQIITNEDVMACNRCHLYSKKQRTSSHCCYICWNPLLLIS